MSPSSEIIRQLLIDGDKGSEEGDWPIYVAFFPPKPDEAICVFDMPGKFDGRIMQTGEKIEHPGIQIMVRGREYLTTWRKVNDIALFLDIQFNVTVALSTEEAYFVNNISRVGPLTPLGVEPEDRRRHHFAINAMLTTRIE